MTIEGKVAQVISERELVINRGERDGVTQGMVFRIVRSEPEVIRDPDTDEVLDEVDVTKVEVEAVTVREKVAICRTFRRIVTPGRPRKAGIVSPYSALNSSIFGDPGTPDSERFQTLRTDEEFIAKELDPAGSYVKRGDRAVEATKRRQ